MHYNFNEIEAKWQKKWDDEKAFEPDDALTRKKKYIFGYSVYAMSLRTIQLKFRRRETVAEFF